MPQPGAAAEALTVTRPEPQWQPRPMQGAYFSRESVISDLEQDTVQGHLLSTLSARPSSSPLLPLSLLLIFSLLPE